MLESSFFHTDSNSGFTVFHHQHFPLARVVNWPISPLRTQVFVTTHQFINIDLKTQTKKTQVIRHRLNAGEKKPSPQMQPFLQLYR